MKNSNINIADFKDARLYDSQIKEDGWEVPRHVSRKKYFDWLCKIRQEPGWESFRRPLTIVTETFCDDDGNERKINKFVSFNGKTGKIINEASHYNREAVISDQYQNESVNVYYTEKMGKHISTLRNILGLTQAELAKKIDVDAKIIKKIESGNGVIYNPEDKTYKLLCSALQVSSIKYQ